MNELWEEICFILRDIPASSNEDVYEQKIIQSLEKIDWSRFQQEIILKQNIQLGSAGEIIPDIVVKLSGKNAFVIEVKKPSVDVENSSHKNQLFSYMRQLKLANGLLIGNKIQIYYDGQLNKAEEPILLKSIEIDKEDKNGLSFIKLFQKSTFSHQKLEKFAEEILKEITAESHKEKLHNLLLSSDYQSKIQQFIVNDLQQNWDSETIEDVLEQLSISISPKNEPIKSIPKPLPSSYHSEINPSQLSSEYIKIGELVRKHIEEIIKFCSKSDEELQNLQNKGYSKQIFKINYPFFKKTTLTEIKPRRYWKRKYKVNNEYYFVTSEWYKESINLFKEYITKI